MRPTTLDRAVRRALAAAGRGSAGEVLVAGLSGGADSVALLDSLARLARAQGFRVVAAHLDHGLRPDSAGDASFCREFTNALGVPLREGAADVRARARRDGGGLEEAARLARRTFLESVRQAEDAAAIVLAHTRDDQAETLLLRLLRGAGPRGLAAMRPLSGFVLRPMLEVSRAAVLEHLEARGLTWREDPSNQDPAMMRNRVRNELLPYLRDRFNPAVGESLARAASLMADAEDAVRAVALPPIQREATGSVALALSDLRALPRAAARLVVREALEAAGGLRGITLVHVDRIVALLGRRDPSGRRVSLPGQREARFHFDLLQIGPTSGAPSAPFTVPLNAPGRTMLPGGAAITASPAGDGDGDATVALPVGQALEVRTRRPGDRVRQGGRDKSLRRFLVERRVPAAAREQLPVVASGTRVLWIPGHPLDSADAGGRPMRLAFVAGAERT